VSAQILLVWSTTGSRLRKEVSLDVISAARGRAGFGEYALILVLVAIVVIAILLLLGPIVGNVFSNIVANI